MNLSVGDSRALNIWQRLYFNAQSSNASGSSIADAWRRLLIQLHTSKKSNKISYELYTRLLQTFEAHYCQIVDNQEPAGQDQSRLLSGISFFPVLFWPNADNMPAGLNNFAETVLTLVSGCRNESQNWSSGLSMDSVKNLPIYNSLLARAAVKSCGFIPKTLLQKKTHLFNSQNPTGEQATEKHFQNKKLSIPTCTASAPGSAQHQSSLIREGRASEAEIKWIDNVDLTSAHSSNSDTKLKGNGMQSIGKHTEEMPSLNTVLQTEGELHFENKRSQIQHRIGREGLPVGGYVEVTSTVLNYDNSRSKGNSGIKRKATSPCLGGDGVLNPCQSILPDGAFTGSDNNHDTVVHNRTFQSKQLMRSSTHVEGYGDRRLSKKTLESKQSCSDPNEQDSNATMAEFITAKQKWIINSKKKNYHQENDVGVLKQGAINNANYGSTRKTLGTRRGPSRQFIPPVLNNSHESDGVERGTGKLNDRKVNSEPEVDERLRNIEPKMVELITNEIMDHGPPLSWDDIAGLEFAKSVIKEIVVWPMLRPDIFKGLRGPPKGVLLFGPPGTGKTLIGKCIASQSKATFFSISASSLTSKWVGEGEKMVRALFAVARCNLPAVIFIDEIDSLLSQRTDGEHDASRRIKTEFLVQLDGATTNSDDRLLVVGATNRPQEIDEAARRRLVKRLYIPLPDAGAREQIMYSLLSQQKCRLSEQEIKQIVQQTHGYSGSDMANLCREAALGPIRSIVDIQCIDADQVPPIDFKDFDAALHQVRASVSEKDLDLYIEWNKLYGSGTK